MGNTTVTMLEFLEVDGVPYSTCKPLKCPEHAKPFCMELLNSMAARAQEYIIPEGRVTTNSVEGFHGLALKYRSKKGGPSTCTLYM